MMFYEYIGLMFFDEALMCLEVEMKNLMTICCFHGHFRNKNYPGQTSWSTLLPVPTQLQMNLQQTQKRTETY